MNYKKEQKKIYYTSETFRTRRNEMRKGTVISDEERLKNNERLRKRNKQRRIDDPMFLMKERIRTRTKAAFLGQGFTKGCATREMLGCSWETFKDHIEKQFTKGMKWSNRYLWHIDHIMPLATAKTENELIQLSHYTNLRPLWASENLSKGAKITECQPELLIKL